MREWINLFEQTKEDIDQICNGMRYQELTEGKNTPCIVVDVQPAYNRGDYALSNTIDIEELCHFLAKQNGPFLMFVNADETGMTDDNIVYDILPWWEEQFEAAGLDFHEQAFEKMEFVDKGYGHFRSWMSYGISEAAIIKTIRLMYQNKVNDSRELFGGEYSDDYEINMKALLGESYDDAVLSDPLAVEWTSVGQLKKFSGAYIMGGGRDECLKEVELLMNAFNIKYKRVEEFIY